MLNPGIAASMGVEFEVESHLSPSLSHPRVGSFSRFSVSCWEGYSILCKWIVEVGTANPWHRTFFAAVR